VEPVKDQLSSVLLKLDSTLTSTNKIVDEQNRREIKMMLVNFNRIIESFQGISDKTNSILANNEKGISQVVDNANKTLLAAGSTLDKYSNVSEKIDVNKLNSAVSEFNQSAAKLNSLISDIEKGKGSIGKLTKDEELYNNLIKSTENLNKLLEDVKANPKRYVHFSVFGKKDK
jgi:phospholipid/cholesterol/gamma-HCH transport system substrate-binding protein